MAKMSYLDVLMEKESARAIVPSIVEAIRGFDPIGQYAMADVNEPAFKSLIQYKIEVGKNSNLFMICVSMGQPRKSWFEQSNMAWSSLMLKSTSSIGSKPRKILESMSFIRSIGT